MFRYDLETLLLMVERVVQVSMKSLSCKAVFRMSGKI